ncbi:MAG: hypothetical protein V7K38_01405 [Nostoc sp.]|uniref:hypothetical protein n=1 Tax=Nostoc sp. TaxID=1180 RepID=UPI002FFAEDBD
MSSSLSLKCIELQLLANNDSKQAEGWFLSDFSSLEGIYFFRFSCDRIIDGGNLSRRCF